MRKRFLAAILALVMVMALTVPALAASVEVAGENGGSLKISDATADGQIEMYFGPCDLYRLPVGATVENTNGTLSGMSAAPVIQDTDGTWKLIYEDAYEGVWPEWEEGVVKRTFVAGTEGYWLVEGYNSDYDTLVRFAVRVEGGSEPEKPVTIATLGLNVTGWAKAEVDKALAAGLYDEALGKNMIVGITRAQAAAVAVKLYEAMKGAAMPEKENPFTDTDDPNVIKAYSLGLIDGNGSGKFGPDDVLTREMVAVMLSKVYVKLGGTIPAAGATPFADDGEISGWAKAEVAFMAEKGIVEGDGTNFAPKGDISGEQALIMGLRMINTLG